MRSTATIAALPNTMRQGVNALRHFSGSPGKPKGIKAGWGGNRAKSERGPGLPVDPGCRKPGDPVSPGLLSNPGPVRPRRQGTGKVPFTAWMPMPIETASQAPSESRSMSGTRKPDMTVETSVSLITQSRVGALS